jgi:hypothetical protein
LDFIFRVVAGLKPALGLCQPPARRNA